MSQTNPAVDVVCMQGRKGIQTRHYRSNCYLTCNVKQKRSFVAGSFEVFVNEVQIYSKLQTTVLPDFDDVIKHVKVASDSGLIIPIATNRCMECVMS